MPILKRSIVHDKKGLSSRPTAASGAISRALAAFYGAMYLRSVASRVSRRRCQGTHLFCPCKMGQFLIDGGVAEGRVRVSG